MSKYEPLVTAFLKQTNKKPVQLLLHYADPDVHFGAASLQLRCDMWILTAPNPAVVSIYNSIDMECCLVREEHLAEEIA
jgi:hypothetical protein